MPKYKAKPTRSQVIMLTFMGLAFLNMIIWSVYEIRGLIDPAAEDTYSEYWFDVMNDWLFWPIVILHIAAGVLFTWAGLHFVEGRIRRHKYEKRELDESGWND